VGGAEGGLVLTEVGLALGLGDGDAGGDGTGIVGNGVNVGIGDWAGALASETLAGALISAGSAMRSIPEMMRAVVRASIPEYTRCYAG